MKDCLSIPEITSRLACEALISRIDSQTEDLEALKKTVEELQEGGMTRVIEHAAEAAAIAGAFMFAVAGLIACGLVLRLISTRWREIGSAEISPSALKLEFEKSSEQVSSLLLDIQTHVIGAAAKGRVLPNNPLDAAAIQAKHAQAERVQSGQPDRANFADGKQVVQREWDPIYILWATDNKETLLFEMEVLRKMGNTVELVENSEAVLKKLEAGNRPDLILSDIKRAQESFQAGLLLFRDLLDGHGREPWSHISSANRIGPKLRFAVYTWPKRLKAYGSQMVSAAQEHAEAVAKRTQRDKDEILQDIVLNTIITSDFTYLTDRINFLQREKTEARLAIETPKGAAL